MTALLSDLSSVVSFVVTQMTSVLTFLVAQPIILVFIGIPLVGTVIGYVTRLVHLKKGKRK